jgi:hypothetical protein
LHKFFPTSSSDVPADNVVDAPDSEEGQQEIDDSPLDARDIENLQPF